MEQVHEPVLTKESLEFLDVKGGGLYIDATVGGGGHTEAILEHGGRVLAIDWDQEAIEQVKLKVKSAKFKVEIGEDITLVYGNFRNIDKIASEYDFVPADGVLFDLGISSIQLGDRERGFSFEADSALDMRIDKENQSVTASDLINSLREDQLYDLFNQTSQKNVSRAVAAALVRARRVKRIERTSQLVDLVSRVYRGRRRTIHPATTIFLALRMAVNSELDNLQEGLEGAFDILRDGGRLVVISFHSGEDRIVKNFMRDKLREGTLHMLTKKPVLPSYLEIEANPRARSAKLRAGEKISRE